MPKIRWELDRLDGPKNDDDKTGNTLKDWIASIDAYDSERKWRGTSTIQFSLPSKSNKEEAQKFIEKILRGLNEANGI